MMNQIALENGDFSKNGFMLKTFHSDQLQISVLPVHFFNTPIHDGFVRYMNPLSRVGAPIYWVTIGSNSLSFNRLKSPSLYTVPPWAYYSMYNTTNDQHPFFIVRPFISDFGHAHFVQSPRGSELVRRLGRSAWLWTSCFGDFFYFEICII